MRRACNQVALAVFPLALCAALATLLSGCGSDQAPAKNDAAAEADARSDSVTPLVPATDRPMALTAAPRASGARPLAPGAKTIALTRAGDRPFDKTFDDMRFDIQPGEAFRREMLPPAVESLAGQRIRIRGYILPTAQQRGIKQFVLVRDNQQCCFGPGAALYDCILVEMQSGNTAQYTIRPVAVEGLFGIQEIVGLDGKHLAIYHLNAESVR